MLQRRINMALVYTGLIVAAFVMLFPFVWLLSTSFKYQSHMYTDLPVLIPRDPETGRYYITFENYKLAFHYLKFDVLFKNTLIVAVINTIANTVLNSLAGYAFARINFPYRETLFKLLLTSLMVPGTVLLIPNVYLVKTFGWYDSLWALIVPFCMSVWNVFLYRQAFMNLPRDLEDAARIDGASSFGIYWRIGLPLVKPVLVTTAVFTFLWNYNNFLWPLVVIVSPAKQTLALGLGSLVSASNQKYHLLVASSVVIALPLITLFAILQRHIVKGIMTGGLKE